MDGQVVRTKIPIPVLLLTIVAVGVVMLLLASAAMGFFLGIVRLVLILTGFAAIGLVGLYLWRRGEIGG